MRRIDFHIHTVAAPSDSQNFVFDFEVLRTYVTDSKLDAIAITNHNKFYQDNYEQIKDGLDIPVFPGAELNITTSGSFGHVLIIADPDDIADFATGMNTFSSECIGGTDHVDWERVVEIFPKLKQWIVIPHYRKSKQIDTPTLEKINSLTGYDALEVSNAKKWLAESSQTDKALVTFSDCRPGYRMPDSDPDDHAIRYAYGFTYIQCGTMSFSSIKTAMANPRNVSVFQDKRDFEILPEALSVSKRMNVILGERSSGKTFTLKRIRDAYEESDCLYVEQFEITNEAKKDEFDRAVKSEDSLYFDKYFRPLQNILNQYFDTDSGSLEDSVRSYCGAVIRYAQSPSDKASDCPIYTAEEYDYSLNEASTKEDAKLRKAACALADGGRRKEIVSEFIDAKSLIELNNKLREIMRTDAFERWQMKKCDETVLEIQNALSKQSSRQPLPSVEPLRQYFKFCCFENRLSSVLDKLSEPAELESENEYKYLKKRTRTVCAGPKEAQNACRAQIPVGTDIASLFSSKMDSKAKLRLLSTFDQAVRADSCRLLFAIKSRIVVNDGSGASLSGGQRAEYLLIHKIRDSAGKDIVLIDEPESSFDNPFLNTDVIELLNDVAEHSTVFLVTHNNSLGVSLLPDCIIYTEKGCDGDYRIYTGSLSADSLVDADGNKRNREEMLLTTMEAGRKAYLDRRIYYGITEN